MSDAIARRFVILFYSHAVWKCSDVLILGVSSLWMRSDGAGIGLRKLIRSRCWLQGQESGCAC